MQKIIEKEKQAWGIKNVKDALHYLKIEKMFMEDHLSKWIPQFCDKIINEAEMSFYREMAEITAKFVNIEAEEISGYIAEARKEVKLA